jgi:tRNA threonylcarbamoyladenosine dehydratase
VFLAGVSAAIAQFADELGQPSTLPADAWRPLVCRLAPEDWADFHSLCRSHGIVVIDAIERQLLDLAAIRRPASNRADRELVVRETLDAAGAVHAYGVWVYLPWERKVVHLLARDDYFDVITDRNRDKITREQQHVLRTKRVGVIGLSVGGEAAVALAQEHLCGTIVLADFDRLDLSNLNRLNAGFDDLGVNKAMIVARRIAKIDPFLEIEVFESGVTAENVERFLDGLDLLVEECDGLRMKFEIRERARARRIDIVFAADERGFLSIEPYASHPELPPFHGRITGAQPPREAFPTPLAFLQALTEWMGGWGAISEESRRSLVQVGTTLCGYPQLASEARYAAGQIGHVARRLLLGERLAPFIGNVDLAERLPRA